jgi:hypothetical protein
VAAMVRVRASRKGLFLGQASFGRSASKSEWVYGFKVALVVDPQGVLSAFGLAEAASDERPIGDALLACDGHEVYLLADKGFTGVGTALVGGLRGSGGRYPEEQLPQSMVESGSPLGF